MRVLSFGPSSLAWWDLLQVEGQPEGQGYLVYRNWASRNGALKPGDDIEFEAASKPVYSDCPYGFVAALRRCSKEASVVE